MKIGTYELLKSERNARRGRYHTAHGSFETPAFMPVGTQGTVKGMSPRDLKEIGAQIILSNTYHLHLRPGDLLIRELGGLHKFMNWDGPILTDSGGYQVFSLAKLRKLTPRGVSFQSHIDGAPIELTPEKVVEIQENLGVDIMMVLDECPPYPSTREYAEQSLELTLDWARRSRDARRREGSLQFGIVQGGMFSDLRKYAAEEIIKIGFDGYALGGLSVGEPVELMYQLTTECAPQLPAESVRYLMGVGNPEDLLHAVSSGIDMFDCVIPTRSARFGRLFTIDGFINIRNASHRTDANPIEKGCECYTCTNFSRAYLSHLFHAREVLAVHLATLHNLFFYQRLMRQIREALERGEFAAFKVEFLSRYGSSKIADVNAERLSVREFSDGDS